MKRSITKVAIAPIDVRGKLNDATVAAIRSAYNDRGIVILRVLDKEDCDALILEQWNRLILTQPYRNEHKIKVEGRHGKILDIHRDQAEFLETVTAPLSKVNLAQFKQSWTLHRGFGACCDPAAFHLKNVWIRIRQNPTLYKVAKQLCQRKEIWVDINRSIQKLPGEGENEFLHWDLNPFEIGTDLPQSVCGKVCYTSSSFVGVAGSHSPAFFAEFKEKYKSYYPNVSQKAAKFGLDPAKPDPMGLWSRQNEFVVPAGCAVFWSPKCLHGQIKRPKTSVTEYGCYLGYFPARPRSRYKEKCNVNECDDRINSYVKGCAPLLWPSLDRIYFYPKRFQNFTGLLQKYIDKYEPDHSSICSRTTQGGKVVPHLEPFLNKTYEAPELTDLGKCLLGSMSWLERRKRKLQKRGDAEQVSGHKHKMQKVALEQS